MADDSPREAVAVPRPTLRFRIVAWLVIGLVRLVRWRVRITGLDHVPRRGGAVIAWNHHSYVDFLLTAYDIYRRLDRPVRFLAKKEVWASPWWGWVPRFAEAVPVDRASRAGRAGALAEAVDALEDGHLVMVAPEGTISPSFELREFATGAARMAAEAGVPLVPSVGWGTHRLLTLGRRPALREGIGAAVLVRFGAPLYPGPDDDPRAVTARLRATMGGMLDEVQRGYPDGTPEGAWWVPARLGGGAPEPDGPAERLATRRRSLGRSDFRVVWAAWNPVASPDEASAMALTPPALRQKDRPTRSRRSCLAVPGSSPKMLDKAQGLAADQVFLDLEDSVAPKAKGEARDTVVSALRDGDWGDKVRVVRVNDATTRWTFRDVITVVEGAGQDLDCIMVPKVQYAGQVEFVDHLITQIEAEKGWEIGRIGLEIQIENAQGLVNAEEILAASGRAEAFIFGPGDMAAALNMPSLTVGDIQPDYPGDHWHWVLSTVLVHARKEGIQAIDGPYAKIKDIEGFREVARRSRVLGFDGKWVLHPAQIEAANDVYGVGQEAFERARDILDAHAEATEEQLRGAVMFGDEMIDEASRKMAEANFETGRAQGLQVRETPDGIPYHERAAWRAENLDPDADD